MDMIPPIWLWARRCMYQKNPTMSTIGQQERQQADEAVRLRRRVLDLDVVLAQRRQVALGDAAVERAGGAELVSPLVGELARDRAVVVVDLDGVDVAGAHLRHEVGVGDRIWVAGAAQQRAEEQDAEGEAEQRPQAPPGHALARKAATARPTRRRGRRGRQTLRAHGDRIRGSGCADGGGMEGCRGCGSHGSPRSAGSDRSRVAPVHPLPPGRG